MQYAGSTSARFVVFVLAMLAACHREPLEKDHGAEPSTLSAGAAPLASATSPPPEPACDSPIAVYRDGKIVRRACESELAAEHLTLLDLSDEWSPSVFADVPELGKKGTQPYRDTFIALEKEEFGDGPEFDRAKADRYLELYGIFPTLGVIEARLLDDKRHACHAAIDDAPIERLEKTLNPWRDRSLLEGEVGHVQQVLRQLEWERNKRRLENLDELRKDPKFTAAFADYDRSRVAVEAVARVQDHLRCDGLLKGAVIKGVLDRGTTEGLALFQRKHMIVSWELDAETKQALLADSRELDFRSVLRSLRERVVDATGLLEDGSALGEPGLVVGRALDSEAFRPSAKYAPIEGAAPDLVATATDAAAKALGLTDPDKARAFFESLGPGGTKGLRVAVELPPAPAYHSANMDLRIEIDRGDVYYDYPYTKSGLAKIPPVEHRPMLIVYARTGEKETALVRWPTTIGGWKPERIGPRQIMMVYKESTVGPRVWRDLVVTPVWVPPDTAPKRELMRMRPDGSWAPNTDLFGPGYASAFGLVKLVHHRVAKMQNVKPQDPILYDEGIGTHGSVSYDSIHHGTSHGCHRLQNHVAIRLGEFLLKHRAHTAKGKVELGYGRSFAWEGKPMNLSFDTGGFRYELTPPVPVEVLRGHIMTNVTSPPRPKPLPENLIKQFAQERFED